MFLLDRLLVRGFFKSYAICLISLLTLYVLAGFLILGVVGGAAVIWFWDRLTPA